jgi:translation initiation factor IF-1
MLKDPTVRGVITEVLPDQLYRIKLDTGEIIIGYLAGKLRINHIHCLAGDPVSVVLSPDGQKGRVVFRG